MPVFSFAINTIITAMFRKGNIKNYCHLQIINSMTDFFLLLFDVFNFFIYNHINFTIRKKKNSQRKYTHKILKASSACCYAHFLVLFLPLESHRRSSLSSPLWPYDNGLGTHQASLLTLLSQQDPLKPLLDLLAWAFLLLASWRSLVHHPKTKHSPPEL